MLRLLALILAMASPVAAQDFDSAIDRWLAGDDIAALADLKTLSEAGDADAQIFLGQIATRAIYWPLHLADLPRRDRNALLRAPGGLSGKSWTAVAAQTDPRARAFDAAVRPGAKTEALLTLLEMGEIAAVRRAFPGVVASGEDWAGALRVAEHPAAPQDLLRVAPSLRALIEGGGNRAAPIVFAHRRTALPLRAAEANPDFLAFEGARLAAMDDVAPVLRFCERSCPASDVQHCVGAIFLTSAPDPLTLLSSPVESLVPTPRYLASPRSTDDTARVVAFTQVRLDQTADPALARLSSCAWRGAQASSSASQ